MSIAKLNNDELFGNEYNILQSAKADLQDSGYIIDELIEKYKILTANYEKLLRLTIKAVNISDLQGKELKRREYEIRNLLDNSNQGFLTFGRDLIVDREYSSECTKLFGQKIANMNILDLLHRENSEQNYIFNLVINDIFDEKDEEIKLSYLQKLPSLLIINDKYVNVNYKIINYEEGMKDSESIMLILTDITEKKRAEDEILYLSYHDKLTNLYNRAYIDKVIPQLQEEANMPLSVIMADMNCLKLTNDVFGHENGDKLIVNAANIFLKCCRSTDVIARWGGDEYVIILQNTSNAQCKKICDRIKVMCSDLEPNPIELSVSLGIATTESPNTSISELFNIAENNMYSNKLLESKGVRRDIILKLEKTLHERCFEDCGHNNRVRNMAKNFGKLLNFGENSSEMINLLRLASLHDIGKVSVPREILGKKGELTQAEMKIAKGYTETGFRLAQSIEEPMLAQAILGLRERWDGEGYPHGIKDYNIPLISRIISILDSYDVMTHQRPYKEALNKEEALKEIESNSGKQYDPMLVDKFIENIGVISHL